MGVKTASLTSFNMRKIILLLVIVATLVSCGSTKCVSYSHRPLAAEGCNVSYSTVQDDGQSMIVVSIKSDRLVFGNNPTMMLKNFKGEVLKLSGVSLQSRSNTGGVLVSNMVVPITELNAMAEFPIEDKNIDFFASGISKSRLNTVPIVHEKEFNSDVIGRYLYCNLLKMKYSKDKF